MIYVIGRFLEVIGMAVVLMGLVVGLAFRTPNATRTELLYLGAGTAVFILGHFLERRGRT